MRKIIFLIIIFLIVFPTTVFAQQRNSEGYIVWKTPGTCKRTPNGIWTIPEHKRWIQSAAGQNDLQRAGLPDRIQKCIVRLTQVDAYGREYVFPSGEIGIINEVTAFAGLIYRNLTFGSGQMLKNVLLGFDAEVFRSEVTDKYSIKWVIDTFKICANQGDRKINIITPQLPPTLPPVTEEVVRYYYQEESVYVPEYQLAKEKSVQFKGIWDGLSRIFAQVWRKPDNFNFQQSIGGSSFTSSNASYLNNNANNSQQQYSENHNNNTSTSTSTSTSTANPTVNTINDNSATNGTEINIK